MTSIAKPIPHENNPLFPLPADYGSLTADGQRKARVNAVRLWNAPASTREDRARNAVASYCYFDLRYLWPDDEADFNPYFYDEPPLQAPDFHLAMVRDAALNRACIFIAPRGSAKTSVFRKRSIQYGVSMPARSELYITSNHDNAEETGNILRTQFTENSRLNDDFSPEYGIARLKPDRGQYPWGADHMQLGNRSWIKCASIGTRLRGRRPRRISLDDPEYDETQSTSMDVIRQQMERLIFKVIEPMIAQRGCSIVWTGTFVTRMHYAWHAMQVERGEDGVDRAVDPRFNFWHRMIIRARYADADGRMRSVWPQMWPLDVREKMSTPGARDAQSLEEIELRIGKGNFAGEYDGNPGSADQVCFETVTEEKHGWWVEQEDAAFLLKPRESRALLCWNDPIAGVQKEPVHRFVRSNHIFMTVDHSLTHGAESDFKVATVMAITPTNILFVLSMRGAQANNNWLTRQIFDLSDEWMVRTAHIEAVRESQEYFQTVENLVNLRARELTGTEHLPFVKRFRPPGNISKETRIEALEIRFREARIKLPIRWRWNRPYALLFDQIAQFNPYARNGGLQHDDHLDTVAMSGLVLDRKPAAEDRPTEKPTNPLDRMRKGETMHEAGVPLHSLVDWGSVDIDTIQEILHVRGEFSGEPESKA